VQHEGYLAMHELLSQQPYNGCMNGCMTVWGAQGASKLPNIGKKPPAKCPQLRHMLCCSIQLDESKFAFVTYSHYQMAFSVHTLSRCKYRTKAANEMPCQTLAFAKLQKARLAQAKLQSQGYWLCKFVALSFVSCEDSGSTLCCSLLSAAFTCSCN